MVAEPFAVALIVAEALDRCGVAYLVGGSLASSLSGEPRSTMDVDFVAALKPRDVASLVGALGDDFHADAEAIAQAIRERSCANLIHYPTAMKIDLFVAGATPFDAEQMGRRQRVRVAHDPDRYLFVYTPEDILLQKLRWYRLGQGVSDRQWRDVLGIVLVQGSALDEAYLRRGAGVLAVSDLLERALVEGRPD